jgi:hypothetical protein
MCNLRGSVITLAEGSPLRASLAPLSPTAGMRGAREFFGRFRRLQFTEARKDRHQQRITLRRAAFARVREELARRGLNVLRLATSRNSHHSAVRSSTCC